MTVSELLSRVSSKELSEWIAFYSLEPWGWEANLYGHAITTSAVMNSHRGKKSDRIFTPQDFLPKPQQEQKKSFAQSLREYFKRWPNG